MSFFTKIITLDISPSGGTVEIYGDASDEYPYDIEVEDGSTIKIDMLFGDSLECASCHDVHAANTFSYLLKIDNAGSDLCLTCHDK